jgi:hypothetical protein
MRAHDLQLVVVLVKGHPGNIAGVGERPHGSAEPVAQLLEQCWGGEGEAQVPGEERRDLGAGLQGGYVGVEIDPVKAFDVQRHVAVEHVVDGHNPHPHPHPPRPGIKGVRMHQRYSELQPGPLISAV